MTHYIAHGKDDTVAVAVVDVRKGQRLTGWDMERDATTRVTAKSDVPLGHKIALKDIAKGQAVVKYNEEIGLATKDIRKGERVHTQNLKTARW